MTFIGFWIILGFGRFLIWRLNTNGDRQVCLDIKQQPVQTAISANEQTNSQRVIIVFIIVPLQSVMGHRFIWQTTHTRYKRQCLPASQWHGQDHNGVVNQDSEADQHSVCCESHWGQAVAVHTITATRYKRHRAADTQPMQFTQPCIGHNSEIINVQISKQWMKTPWQWTD